MTALVSFQRLNSLSARIAAFYSLPIGKYDKLLLNIDIIECEMSNTFISSRPIAEYNS
jgi:hypothetical protein